MTKLCLYACGLGLIWVQIAIATKLQTKITTLTAKPSVQAAVPISGDIEVALTSPISLTFSQKMVRQSVESAIEVTPKVDFTSAWQGNTLTLTPKTQFKRGQTITLTLTTTARGLNFRRLSNPYTLKFTTLSNPDIAAATPSGVLYEPAQNIFVMFSKSIQIPQGDILKITPPIEGESKWIGSTAYLIKPKDLIPGQKYHVELTTSLTSLDGGTLEKGYAFDFVNKALTVLNYEVKGAEDTYFSDKAAWIMDATPNGPIILYFNQKVDQASLEQAFELSTSSYIKAPAQNKLPISIKLVDRTSKDDREYYSEVWQKAWVQKAVITPVRPLKAGSSYTVTLTKKLLSALKNTNLEEDTKFSFGVANQPGYLGASIQSGQKDVAFNTQLVFNFNSPMALEELEAKLVISPSLSKPYLYLEQHSKRATLGVVFAPSTTYTVSFAPGLKDAYGRVLPGAPSVTFTTKAYSADVELDPAYQSALSVVSGVDLRVISKVVNASQLEYNLYSLDLNQFTAFLTYSKERWNISKHNAQSKGLNLVASYLQELDVPLNVYTNVVVNLAKSANIEPPPGMYLLDVRVAKSTTGIPPVAFSQMLLVVGDVAVTGKYSDQSVLLWATSFSKADLKQDYTVEVYSLARDFEHDLTFATPPLKPELTGKTNSDGLFTAKTELFKNIRYNQQRLVVLKQTDPVSGLQDIGISLNTWDDGIAPYEFSNLGDSVFGPVNASAPYKGVVISDKTLYRPGEPVKFQAIVRKNFISNFALPEEATQLQLTVTRMYAEQSTPLFDKTYALAATGLLDDTFTIPKSAQPGRYNLDVSINKVSIHSYTFEVQDYRLPEFEVAVKVPTGPVSKGSDIVLETAANYFYGAPLDDAPVTFRLYKRNFVFSSKAAPEYKFYSNRKYFGNDNIWRGFEETEVLTSTSKTNQTGSAVLTPPASTTQGISELYNFEADVTDVSKAKYTGRGEYVVHMAQHYTGIKTSSYVAEQDKPLTVEVKTITPQGENVAQVPVNISLYSRKYFRTKTTNSEGQAYYQVTFEDELKAAWQVETNSAGNAMLELIPKLGGMYFIEAKSFDRQHNESVSDTVVYVTSGDSGYFKRENNDRIELVPDKASYNPGDVAQILPVATLDDAYALITVEAEDLLDSKVIKLGKASSAFPITIKDTYIPNIYVSAVLYKHGTGVLDPPQFRMGVTNLTVSSAAKKLTVQVVTGKTSYLPKEQGTGVVTVFDNLGQLVKNAHVGLAIVDDAVLTMSPIKRSDIFAQFYAPRRFGVSAFANLTRSLNRINVNTDIGAKGGSGGGKGGAGGEFVDLSRANFATTALWTTNLVTNDRGEASFSFEVPDSLTRWNIFAFATTRLGDKFGQGQLNIGSQKGVFSTSAFPRFLRAQDKFSAAVVVHNTTTVSKNLRVEMKATNITILEPTASTKAITLIPGATSRVEFAAQAQQPGSSDLTVTVSEGEEIVDVLVTKLPVLEFGLEANQTFSNVVNSYAKEVFTVSKDAVSDLGQLTFTIYPSVGGLAVLLADRRPNQDFNLEPTTWQLAQETVPLIYAYTYRKTIEGLLDSASEQVTGLEKINSNIKTLAASQNFDGGWGYLSYAKESNPVLTTDVVEALLEANKIGVLVESELLKKATSYLRANQSKVGFPSEQGLRTAYILRLAKTELTAQLEEGFQKRAQLSDISKAYLALAMLEDRATWSKSITQLTADLTQKADLAAQRLFWTGSLGYSSLCSDQKSTATVLRVFNKISPTSPIANLAIRYLAFTQTSVAQQKCYSGLKSIALLENSILTKLRARPNTVEIKINEKLEASNDLKSSKIQKTMPLLALPQGTNNFEVFLKNNGAAYYSLVVSQLLPYANVPAASNGVAIERELLDDRGQNLAPDQKLKLGNTYLVKLTLAVPAPRSQLVIEDYLPAGFEPVNGTLTNESLLVTAVARPKTSTGHFGTPNFEASTSVTRLYIQYLFTGVYEYTYAVKATTSGTFNHRPAVVYEVNSPDVRGNSLGGQLSID